MAGFLSVAAVVWAGSGYLPNAGPVPLRFRALPLLSTNWVSAPATVPSNIVNMEFDEDADAASPDAVIPPLAGTNTSGSNAVIMEASSAPSLPVNVEPIISPQVLMQFFRPATNGASGAAPAPVGFQQPAPSAASVTPPAKSSP